MGAFLLGLLRSPTAGGYAIAIGKCGYAIAPSTAYLYSGIIFI
ncbi:hypothetical protein [Nostoc sp. UHCC 0302]